MDTHPQAPAMKYMGNGPSVSHVEKPAHIYSPENSTSVAQPLNRGHTAGAHVIQQY